MIQFKHTIISINFRRFGLGFEILKQSKTSKWFICIMLFNLTITINI